MLTGLATLTHQNAILLVLPLGVAVVGAAGGPARRAGGACSLLLLPAATIAPWTIRNAVELHHFVPVSDETGITLRRHLQPATRRPTRTIPYKWRFFWDIPPGRAPGQDRRVATPSPQLDGRLQSQALDYIGAHPTAPLQRRLAQPACGCSSSRARPPGTPRRGRSACTPTSPTPA